MTPLPTPLTLHSTVGGSDKLYQIIVRPADATTYNVHYANGPRTGTLTSGKRPKNETPLPLAETEKLCAQLERKQHSKGYHALGQCPLCADTTTSASMPATRPDIEATSTINTACQLLTPLKGVENCRTLEDFLEITQTLRDDPDYCFEQKYDGIRILLHLDETGKATAFNRTESTRGISSAITNELQIFRLNAPIMFDGENIGDKFHIFDLLQIQGLDIRSATLDQRNAQLTTLLKMADGKLNTLALSPTAYTSETKTQLLIEMYEKQMEGVVAKKRSSAYCSGRAGNQFKIKFVSEASFIVTEVKPKGKNSVAISIINEAGQLVSAGHVSIRPIIKNIKLNDILDVRYLYARRSSGHIVQAVAQRIRHDIQQRECTTAQLKYKEGE